MTRTRVGCYSPRGTSPRGRAFELRYSNDWSNLTWVLNLGWFDRRFTQAPFTLGFAFGDQRCVPKSCDSDIESGFGIPSFAVLLTILGN